VKQSAHSFSISPDNKDKEKKDKNIYTNILLLDKKRIFEPN